MGIGNSRKQKARKTCIIKKPGGSPAERRDLIMAYEAQRKYDKANTILVSVKLNIKTDADILEVLNACDNKQGFIKQCIRNNIDKIPEN